MDDVTALTTFITNVGFPISVCCWLFYERYKGNNHLQKAVENNTLAIKQLSTIITRGGL